MAQRRKTAAKTAAIEKIGKVAAYLRISTDGQEKGYGLDVQRQHIVAYATANGISIDIWLQDIESGAKEDRPALAELREGVKSGEIGTVLVYRLDRLARKVGLGDALYEEMTKKAKVISVTEAIDKGFTGDLLRHMITAIAQYERALMASRLKSGRKESVRKNGTYAGGPGVLGYRPVGKKGEPGKGALRVVEGEAEAVRAVFEMDAQGMTLAQIAGELNAKGYRTVKGAEFRPTQVHRILYREDFYRGAGVLARSYEAEKVAHEAII